ncbi:3732_t:CDS:2, partial [Dentiscutata erythropus]
AVVTCKNCEDWLVIREQQSVKGKMCKEDATTKMVLVAYPIGYQFRITLREKEQKMIKPFTSDIIRCLYKL